MAHRRVEEYIDALQDLGESGATAAAAATLRKALTDRVGLVVAKAAKMTAQLQLRDLIPDLLRAFDRLFENPLERDPQCWGKNAIAKALTELDYRESSPFLRGARHIQIEPAFLRPEDTATNLRGICVLGLASCTDIRSEELFRCLVDRLADDAYTVRVEAARAIAQMAGEEAALLLRLKARVGDEDPRVIGQVFDCLLAVEGVQAVDWVAEFLHSAASDVPAEAALSLGMSRLPGTGEALEKAYEATPDPDLRVAILRGLSASRQERAIEFLLGIVRKGRDRDVAQAMEALALHKDSAEIRSQAQAAAKEAGPAAEERYHRAFR